jgi:hypothetical protein
MRIALLLVVLLALAACKPAAPGNSPFDPHMIELSPDAALRLLALTVEEEPELFAHNLSNLLGLPVTPEQLPLMMPDSLTRVRSLVETHDLHLLRPPRVSDRNWAGVTNDAISYYSDLFMFPISVEGETKAWVMFNTKLMSNWGLDLFVRADGWNPPEGYLVTANGPHHIRAADPNHVRMLSVFESRMAAFRLDEDSLILEIR